MPSLIEMLGAIAKRSQTFRTTANTGIRGCSMLKPTPEAWAISKAAPDAALGRVVHRGDARVAHAHGRRRERVFDHAHLPEDRSGRAREGRPEGRARRFGNVAAKIPAASIAGPFVMMRASPAPAIVGVT